LLFQFLIILSFAFKDRPSVRSCARHIIDSLQTP